MLIDYHIHPDYSYDADGAVDDYCEQALRMGVSEICFTTHYNLGPIGGRGYARHRGRVIPSDHEGWLADYWEDVKDAAHVYRDQGLTVKAGLEVDYIEGREEGIQSAISGFPWDYVMGSVHYIEGLSLMFPDEARRIFRDHTIDTLVASYYRKVVNAVELGVFNTIAHLDCYGKYGQEFYGEEILRAHRGCARPALEGMARMGVGIEVNTAPWRRRRPEFMPSNPLLKDCREAGIEVVTVGSDAHGVTQLGRWMDEAVSAAEAAGFTHIYTFTSGRPEPHDITDFRKV